MSRRSLPLAILASLGLAVTGCNAASVKPLPAPPTVKVLPTTTTFPDFSGTSIPPVKGSTTTAPPQLRGGTSSLHGKVTLSGAPVAGADVRIDRFVGTQSVGTDTTTAADGTWSFAGIVGGRYRIRAYRPPDATLSNPVTIFVNEGANQEENFSLSQFGGALTTGVNIAPDPPNLGDVANVVVQVTSQGVDGNGIARSIGQPNLGLLLVTAGGRTIITPNPAVTNSTGTAEWTIRCDSLDNQGLTVQLPDGTTAPVNVSACRLPPPVTTIPPTTTTAATH